jgi:hypothetical protein
VLGHVFFDVVDLGSEVALHAWTAVFAALLYGVIVFGDQNLLFAYRDSLLMFFQH